MVFERDDDLLDTLKLIAEYEEAIEFGVISEDSLREWKNRFRPKIFSDVRKHSYIKKSLSEYNLTEILDLLEKVVATRRYAKTLDDKGDDEEFNELFGVARRNLQSQQNQLEKEINDRFRNLSKNLEEANARIREAEHNVADETDRLREEIKDLRLEHTRALQEKETSFDREKKILEGQINEIRKKLEVFNEIDESQVVHYKNIPENIVTDLIKYSKKYKEVANKGNILEDAVAIIFHLEEEVERLKKLVEDSEKRIKNAEVKERISRNDAENFQASLMASEADLSEFRDQFLTYQNQLNEFLARVGKSPATSLRELINSLEDLNGELTTAQSRIAELEENVTNLEHQKQSLEQRVAFLEKESSELRINAEIKSEECERLQQRINELNDAKRLSEEKEQDLINLRNDLAASEISLAEERRKVEELERVLYELREKLAKSEEIAAENESLYSRLATVEENLNTANKDLDQSKARIQELELEITNLRTESADLKLKVETQTTKIEKLNKEISKSAEEYNELVKKLREQEAESNEKLEVAGRTVEEKFREVQEMNLRLHDLEEDIKSKIQEIDELISENRDLHEEVQRLDDAKKEEKNSYEEKLDESAILLQQHETRIDELNGELIDLRAEIQRLEGNNRVLSTQVENLRKDINTKETALANAAKELEKVQSKLNEVKNSRD
jgi:chromosome segregation ATPase